MLTELARTTTIARPERFFADHQRAVARAREPAPPRLPRVACAPGLGPVTAFVRWGIELVARYIVVSYVQTVTTDMRNLYWFREIEAPDGSHEMKLLRSARFDAAALAEIARGRAFGVPTFVVGALLLPLFASIYRLATGYVGRLGHGDHRRRRRRHDRRRHLVVPARGTAMASSRIRLSVREPLKELWTSVGNCGNPPRDHSRKFAIIGITLTVGVWIVVPTLVGPSCAESL